MRVGYVTDPADAGTFVPLMSVSSAQIGDNDYHNYLVKFDSVVTAGTLPCRIAFKYEQDANWYWFVDDIQVTVIPPCPEPSSLSAGSVTASTANLSWTDVADSYVVYYKAEGDSVYSEAAGATLTNGVYMLGGLAAGTGYEWYVASVCDNGIIAPSFTTGYFITQCAEISNFPVTWDFESDLQGGIPSYPLPRCWSRIAPTGPNAQYPYVTTNGDNALSGTHNLIFYNVYGGAYGVLPEIDAAALSIQNVQLTFYAKSNYASQAVLEVGVMDDPEDASTFSTVQTFNIPAYYSGVPYEVLFYTYTGSGRHIAFRYLSPVEVFSSFYIDDVTIDEAPACAHPMVLTATASTSNSVTLSWVAAPGQTEWEIAYGSSGFMPDNAPQTVTATSNPFTVSGLQESTTYQFYVRAVCSPGEASTWSNGASGATDCGIATLPYAEDFESYQGSTYDDNNGIAPSCWTTYSTNTVYGVPHITSSGSYHYVNSGTNSMVFTSGGSGNDSYAALPTFTEPLNTLSLTFWYAMENVYHGTLMVGYVTNLDLIGATFVAVDTIPSVSPTQGTTIAVDFTGADIPAAGNICFRWTYDESYYSCCIDDIEVLVTGGPGPEPCNVPTGLHVTNIQNESISVVWDDADVDTWYVRRRPENGEWATVTATANSYTFTGLTPGTQYEIQVQADCGDDNLSEWSGSVTAQTTNVSIDSWLEGGVTLYPNPAKEYVDIRVDGDLNVTMMEIYDVYGKFVNTVNVVENPTRINVSGLANGMYFVRVTTEEGVVTKAFVKR